MKRNVDLTLKRDFNDIEKSSFFETISRSLRLRFWDKKELPWRTTLRLRDNDNTWFEDIEVSYDNILITGNKVKRAEAKFYRKINKNICECCGKPLGYIPWKIKYVLCCKCSETYQYNQYKSTNISWRNKINLEQNSKKICWR